MKRPGLFYRAGGNPPYVPALLLDGEVIAWWPAIPPPDQTTASRVLMAYQAKGTRLTREDVRGLTSESD